MDWNDVAPEVALLLSDIDIAFSPCRLSGVWAGLAMSAPTEVTWFSHVHITHDTVHTTNQGLTLPCMFCAQLVMLARKVATVFFPFSFCSNTLWVLEVVVYCLCSWYSSLILGRCHHPLFLFPHTYIQRWYFLSSSDCHMYFLSGKRSGILIRRKSWMHFSSSCSGVIFSLLAFLFAASRSRTPKVLTRSMSVLRRISVCCSMWPGPLGRGRSSVWMLGRLLTGPQITVSWGELASDWVSEQEVESSLKEVPLSPSRSLLWLLQQQSQWEDNHLEGPPLIKTPTQTCLSVVF